MKSLTFWAILFFIAVSVRLPFLNRPLSGNYEWLTAHTLITYDIWNKEGILQHHFLPVYTYPDSTNFHIPIGDLGSVEKNGRLYYVSYPAFGFIFPYLISLGYANEPIILKMINIFLHFISAIVLWKILKSFFSPLSSFLSVSFFLLQPNLLWFHGNVYFLDVLSMDGLILQLYCTLKYFQNPVSKNIMIWLVVNLLLCQTEWIGYLVLFTVGLYCIYQKEWKLFVIMILWGILNFGITIIHYGSFLGYENYGNALLQKGLKRIGNSDAISHHWGEWKPLLFFIINFMIYEFTLLMAMFFNIGNILSHWEDLKKKFHLTVYKKLLILAGLPVFLHYIILFNFTTGHSALAAVIANPWLVLLLAPMLEMLVNTSHPIGKKIGILINLTIIGLGLIFFLLRNNHEFQWYFKIHFTNYNFTPTHEFQTLGNYIHVHTPPNYIPAILYPEFFSNPQITFYAKKNILQFFSPEEAQMYVQKHQVKLKIYKIDSSWKVVDMYDIEP